jgi:hypothetical protein
MVVEVTGSQSTVSEFSLVSVDGGAGGLSLLADDGPRPRCGTRVWQVSFFNLHREHGT